MQTFLVLLGSGTQPEDSGCQNKVLAASHGYGKLPRPESMQTSLHTIRVWDLPTRIFHWCLAVAVLALFVTGKMGGDAMLWHSRIAYGVGTLLLFRLIWGFAGGHWSRFASFMVSPRSVGAYLRRNGSAPAIGHSPLGAASVYAMLLFLTLQFASGLFSENRHDDFAGPLNALVSGRTAQLLTVYHKKVGQIVLIVLVLLHVAAVAWHQFRLRRPIIGAMWHGNKQMDSAMPVSRDDKGTRFLAAALLAVCAAAVAALVSLGGP
jgi:cytochrome b